MIVTGFEVFPVVCPPPFRGGRSWLFVRLDTDDGTRGYGEMMLLGVGFRLPVLAAMMADVIEQARCATGSARTPTFTTIQPPARATPVLLTTGR